jgi:hypothetical protein
MALLFKIREAFVVARGIAIQRKRCWGGIIVCKNIFEL